MKEILVHVLITVALVAVWVGIHVLAQRRTIRLLHRWASRNRFKLVEYHERTLMESAPFSFWTSHRRPNFFVRVLDENQRQRTGWVRIGTATSSIWGNPDAVEVKWDGF